MVVHGAVLATLITGLIFWGSPRFRDANLPFLMLYAAVGLTLLCSHQNVNKTKRSLLTSQTNGYLSDNRGQAVPLQQAAQSLHEHQ
jgi:hypothetical protein